MERFDVLVAGGGTAGCVLAARLSEDPARSVCLVEAGPDYGAYPEGRWPEDILDARRLALDSHRWAQLGEDRSEARARVLGGCSSHNACALVRARENLTIVADTLVDRVLRENGRAAGVATSRGELRAHTIVLAAGAYGTPAILLRSGFGPPVGDGLTDHVGVGMGWQPTQALQDDCAGFEVEHPLFMAGTTIKNGDLFLFPALDPGYEISSAVFFMKPHSRGSVRLSGDDPEA